MKKDKREVKLSVGVSKPGDDDYEDDGSPNIKKFFNRNIPHNAITLDLSELRQRGILSSYTDSKLHMWPDPDNTISEEAYDGINKYTDAMEYDRADNHMRLDALAEVETRIIVINLMRVRAKT